MVRLVEALAVAVGVLPLAFQLHGCGGGGPDDTTVAPTTSPGSTTTEGPTIVPIPACEAPRFENGRAVCDRCVEGFTQSESKGACLYKCESELDLGEVTLPQNKGLCVDDTTWRWCPDRLLSFWANTEERVTSLRLFKAWASWWPEDDKLAAWQSLATFAQENNVTILVGTEITCNETNDDEDWANVIQLVELLGAKYIMGVAIGNELELLWQKSAKQLAVANDAMKNECLERIWNQDYFVNKFHSRIADLDALGSGFDQIKVSSVFGGFALSDKARPFYEQGMPKIARVESFFKDVLPKYGDRYAFTLNIYPYFDPDQYYDEPKTQPPTCKDSLARSLCFQADDPKHCLFSATVFNMREAMNSTLTSLDLSPEDGLLWIGETGWSSPRSGTLDTHMKWCSEWSEKQVQREYYENFLAWNLTLNGARGADHVFYFAMRDSVNFNIEEGFGLVGDGDGDSWCANTTCKLADVYPGQRTTTPYTGPPTTTTARHTRSTTTTKAPSSNCCFGASDDDSCSDIRATGKCRPDRYCGDSQANCEGGDHDDSGGCGGRWCPASGEAFLDGSDMWYGDDQTLV